MQGWLASRLVLLTVMLAVAWAKGEPLSRIVQHWDADHFVAIATTGYTTLTETAYFPGLPLVMAAFNMVGAPPALTGVLASLAGSGMAAWALYRLSGGGAAGAVAVLAWSFAPMTVFTFVPYTEAVCCALAFWAFWHAKADRWGLAAVCAAGACAFRVSGLFLIGALGLVGLLARRRADAPRFDWRRRLARIAWLGLPTAVLAAYAIFLRVNFGSWTAWFEAQGQGWGRQFNWPWRAVDLTLRTAGVYDSAPLSPMAVIFCWEVAACLIGVAVTAWCLATKQIPEGGWVASQLLALSCQVWLISLARSMVLWFPLFSFVGLVAATRVRNRVAAQVARLVGVLLFGCEVVCMVWWSAGYFSGAWSG